MDNRIEGQREECYLFDDVLKRIRGIKTNCPGCNSAKLFYEGFSDFSRNYMQDATRPIPSVRWDEQRNVIETLRHAGYTVFADFEKGEFFFTVIWDNKSNAG